MENVFLFYHVGLTLALQKLAKATQDTLKRQEVKQQYDHYLEFTNK
jgi:hypothetical protein